MITLRNNELFNFKEQEYVYFTVNATGKKMYHHQEKKLFIISRS